jgi:uncharacterized membrane protein
MVPEESRAREENTVPLWQKLLITLAVMLVASFIAGLLWRGIFNTDMPSYLSGVAGGISAVLAWEFLRRVGPKLQP